MVLGRICKGDMPMNKKLQVFVSSTYADLIEERRAAVEAILDAGHIPAGMELFKAGKSQMKTIQKWIDESDIYMLILGGRYGSIEEKTGLSYTELEYRYALSKNIPVFAIVLDDSLLFTKAALSDKNFIFENKNKKKYNSFKKVVKENIVKFVNSIDAISSTVHSQLNYIQSERKDTLCGWVRYSDNKINFDDQNSLTTLIKSYNNLLDEYAKISANYHSLSKEFRNQLHELINIKKEKTLLYDQLLEKSIDNDVYDKTYSLPYDPNDYKSKEKLLEYAKLSMYKYKFKEIKFNGNFYTLKRGITYSLEDFFIVLYQLSYCKNPIEIFPLGEDGELFRECLSIFFYDNLFQPCNVFNIPIMLTAKQKGDELYKYLISNSV